MPSSNEGIRSKNMANGNYLTDFVLLSGRANPKLAKDIGKILGKEVDEPISVFADGEIRVKIEPNLRRRHVCIVQSTSSPVNDNLMELLLMIDAAKRASASEIVAVIPYFGYSRQDRKEMSRVPISASLVAGLIDQAGADRILTVDIHSEQAEGFIKKPWDNVYASYSLVPELKKRKLTDLIIASPDKGGVVRAAGYAKLLNASGIAIVYKDRDIHVNDSSEALTMVGNVKGKDVLLVDDMISTGGTLLNAADYLKKQGAKSVRAAVTHGLFTGSAMEKIEASTIDEIIVTDTIALSDKMVKNKKISVISVAPLVAGAISRIQSGDSISKDLIL